MHSTIPPRLVLHPLLLRWAQAVCWRVLFVALSGAVFPACVASDEPRGTVAVTQNGSNNATILKPKDSAMENLIQSVLNKDPGASTQARAIGPAANPGLIRLTHERDAKVRRIALYCLDETGGSDAAEAFAQGVLDENSQVRAAALRGLEHHYQQAPLTRLLGCYDRSPDAYVRQQIMLVIAQAGRDVEASAVKERYQKESDALAKEGGLVALASLNDAEARTEFARRLEASTGAERLRFLEYCERLHQPWLLRPLAGLLGDTNAAVRVAVDARPDLVQQLRVCDVAVNLIASISKHSFSFPVNRATNYGAMQLDEVREFVRKSQ